MNGRPPGHHRGHQRLCVDPGTGLATTPPAHPTHQYGPPRPQSTFTPGLVDRMLDWRTITHRPGPRPACSGHTSPGAARAWAGLRLSSEAASPPAREVRSPCRGRRSLPWSASRWAWSAQQQVSVGHMPPGPFSRGLVRRTAVTLTRGNVTCPKQTDRLVVRNL